MTGQAGHKSFSWPMRVYYRDTDAGGVVFHAQYLAFMERARTELLNASGIDLARLAEERGLQFMVAHLQVKYHRGARRGSIWGNSPAGTGSFLWCIRRKSPTISPRC